LLSDRCIQKGKELIGTQIDLAGVCWLYPEQGAAAGANKILVASGVNRS
jgi:hypothetical protein